MNNTLEKRSNKVEGEEHQGETQEDHGGAVVPQPKNRSNFLPYLNQTLWVRIWPQKLQQTTRKTINQTSQFKTLKNLKPN